ncbi:MAG: tRNA uridine-5-carboxymethylaminomethyl(34) synthesis GTPase MnmE [Candidatus Dadabacteria bacterium]|nr:tRNA uridine-5-carboxymethylaminomethyl(34) synthesis GTPase MnmE [Candidatus Dadabacteria bacterium]MCY4262767.1 tRNA uridine-5-carboxymethylaminomethyl(34) synthesis GTPase MnmE [Candidatus Dadabacteria bacterium]
MSLPKPESTIAAISTPPGEGGIAVVRVSGAESHTIVKKIFLPAGNPDFSERKLFFGKIIDTKDGSTVDEVLCVFMNFPDSYTGENVAEIHSHGGYMVPRRILEIVIGLGADLAAPGEFTRRAFLNAKMDLAQAEAVSDIINAQTEQSLRYAEAQLAGNLSGKINGLKDRILDVLAEIEANLDFPEEDIDPIAKKHLRKTSESVETELSALIASYDKGRMFRDGVTMVMLGKPNVGKSSILNCLLETERAIVSPIAGTTRDFIEEKINLEGIPLTITDTAGVRDTEDQIEKLGVELSLKKAEESEFVLVILDQSTEIDSLDRKILETASRKNHLVVINKMDLEEKFEETELQGILGKKRAIRTSALTKKGIEHLRQAIFDTLAGSSLGTDASEPMLTNLRHKKSIEKAREHLRIFLKLLSRNEYPEILSIELRNSMNSLGQVTGEVSTEDLLGRIFSRFCIGK